MVNLMLPGLAEGRDILATTGRDGSLSIVDAFTNGLDDDGHTLQGGLVASFKVNQRGGAWGLKDVRVPYVPDEGLEDRMEENRRPDEEFYRRVEELEGIKTPDEIMEDMEKEEAEACRIKGIDPLARHKPYQNEAADEYGENTEYPPWTKK